MQKGILQASRSNETGERGAKSDVELKNTEGRKEEEEQKSGQGMRGKQATQII